MKNVEIEIETTVPAFNCSCGQTITVIMHMANSWAYWGNDANPPYCPFCGNKIIDALGNAQQVIQPDNGNTIAGQYNVMRILHSLTS